MKLVIYTRYNLGHDKYYEYNKKSFIYFPLIYNLNRTGLLPASNNSVTTAKWPLKAARHNGLLCKYKTYRISHRSNLYTHLYTTYRINLISQIETCSKTHIKSDCFN